MTWLHTRAKKYNLIALGTYYELNDAELRCQVRSTPATLENTLDQPNTTCSGATILMNDQTNNLLEFQIHINPKTSLFISFYTKYSSADY